jgi:hypothetical protein
VGGVITREEEWRRDGKSDSEAGGGEVKRWEGRPGGEEGGD